MKPTIATVALLIALAVAGCDSSTAIIESVVESIPRDHPVAVRRTLGRAVSIPGA